MRVLLGLLVYLGSVIAIVGGAATVLSSPPEPGAQNAARPAASATASPRIQAWLERRAEGVAFAEKERAAAQAERERADALRAKLAATPAPYVAPRAPEARAPEADKRRAAERERAARARDNVRREARRRLRDLDARTAYSYAPEPRHPAYVDDFLTRRDRYGY